MEHQNPKQYLRYRLREIIKVRDEEKSEGLDVDDEFVESIINLCRRIEYLDDEYLEEIVRYRQERR